MQEIYIFYIFWVRGAYYQKLKFNQFPTVFIKPNCLIAFKFRGLSGLNLYDLPCKNRIALGLI